MGSGSGFQKRAVVIIPSDLVKKKTFSFLSLSFILFEIYFNMTEKMHNEEVSKNLEDLSYDNKINAIDEVGVLDAPNGGKAAWMVVFGSFCVRIIL